MQQTATNPYLRTRVMTASPQQLRLMLFDGAIKFCRQGRDGLASRDFEAMYNGLSRAKKIVLELSTSLNHDADPDLCANLAGLYTYIYRRIVEANLQRDAEAIDEALELLEHERETWRMLMDKLNGGGSEADGAAAAPASTAETGAPSGSSVAGPTSPGGPVASGPAVSQFSARG